MTTLTERVQAGSRAQRRVPGPVALEGAILLLATPLLLFPSVAPVAAAAALAALALVWLFSLSFARTRLPVTPFNVVLLLWGGALIVGIATSADPAETLDKATGLILGLAVWRFLTIAVISRRQLAVAVAALLLMGLGFIIIGAFGLQEVPKIPALATFNPSRMVSLPIAIHPNQLAGLICLYLPLLVALLFDAPVPFARSLWRVAFALLGLLVVLILVLSQSRGGWLGAAAGLFSLLALWAAVLPASRARRALRLLAAAVLVSAVAAALWIGPGTLRDLWLNPPAETVVGTLTTLNYRKELWPWAITAVGDFPFTGVGLGAFRAVAFRLYPLPLVADQDIGHAHNIFVQTALDVGLPGLVVYVALLLVAAASAWRAARVPAFRAVSLGLLAGMIALHVFGIADALALGSKPGLVFWFSIGLLTVMNKEEVAHEA